MMKKCRQKITRDELMTFSQAYLHEPAVIYGKLQYSSVYKYFFGEPSNLPKHLFHFCLPDDSITYFDGPSMRN